MEKELHYLVFDETTYFVTSEQEALEGEADGEFEIIKSSPHFESLCEEASRLTGDAWD